MNLIKGMEVTLYDKVQVGQDNFDMPIYEEKPIVVEDVLVGLPTTDDITVNETMYGKKTTYMLAIPKGDTHEWENRKVSFFGQTFRTFGNVIQGIEENIPLRWNKKISVERYE